MHADLIDQLNPKNPLLLLARKIDWTVFENEFADLYSHLGKPNKHIRLMVGLSMLKHLENLSDDVLVQRWVQNPYYQSFCGKIEFQWQLPCVPTSLTNFRKRIGVSGHEEIMVACIALRAERVVQEDEICIDTTVQEKNITFPIDAKQYRKIHGKLLEKEGIHLEVKARKVA